MRATLRTNCASRPRRTALRCCRVLLDVKGGEQVRFSIPAQDHELAVTALDRAGNESLPKRLRGPGR